MNEKKTIKVDSAVMAARAKSGRGSLGPPVSCAKEAMETRRFDVRGLQSLLTEASPSKSRRPLRALAVLVGALSGVAYAHVTRQAPWTVQAKPPATIIAPRESVAPLVSLALPPVTATRDAGIAREVTPVPPKPRRHYTKRKSRDPAITEPLFTESRERP